MDNLELKESIAALYEQMAKIVNQDLINQSIDLLNQTIENVTNFISQYVDIHKKFYTTNETYRKFVQKTLEKDKNAYQKIVDIGQAIKNLNTIRSVRSLGLFNLTRKVFGLDNKNAEKKCLEWLNNIEPVMEAYNISVDTGDNFVVLLLTLFKIKQITFDAIKDYVYNANFN